LMSKLHSQRIVHPLAAAHVHMEGQTPMPSHGVGYGDAGGLAGQAWPGGAWQPSGGGPAVVASWT
jgi:hypothetical protein